MLTNSMFKKYISLAALATLVVGTIPSAIRAEIRTLEQVTSQQEQLVHQLIAAACVSCPALESKVQEMFCAANGRSNANGETRGTVIASTPTAQLQALLENLSADEYFKILEVLVTKFFDANDPKPFYLAANRSQKDIFVALGKSLVACAIKSPQIDAATRTRLMKLLPSLDRVEELKTANLITLGALATQFRHFADLLPAYAQSKLSAIGIFDVRSMIAKTKTLLEQRINN